MLVLFSKPGESVLLRLARAPVLVEGRGVVDLAGLVGAPPGSSVDWALTIWQTDTALGSVRDPAALAKLPAEERANWQRFWASGPAIIQSMASFGVMLDSRDWIEL